MNSLGYKNTTTTTATVTLLFSLLNGFGVSRFVYECSLLLFLALLMVTLWHKHALHSPRQQASTQKFKQKARKKIVKRENEKSFLNLNLLLLFKSNTSCN